MPDAGAGPIVAVIAAEAIELDSLRRHASHWEVVDWPGVESVRRAVIGGADWFLLANGPGVPNACAALQEVESMGRPLSLVVSAGFCGALDPALEPGDIVRATDFELEADALRPQALLSAAPPASQGRYWTLDHVASTAAEKLALGQTGAKAVDMEAGGLALYCGVRDIPFCAVKVVTDRADEDLPLDFNRYRRADGRFDRAAIARAAALRPWVAWKLWTFAGRCRRASAVLADYLVECRFGEIAE